MKRNLLLLLTACFCLSLGQAQSVKITGVVVDSTGMPLQMANVIAYQKDNNLGAFGITNVNGKYQLQNLKKDSTYVIKVSFLGLKPVEDTIKNIQQDLVKNYVMVDGPDELDAVNIVYDMPVSIKGDTIVYNSDSFTNGTERKLGDVLNKLPGMEVNEDGDIQVEGKTVEKVMVDGKDFFEGDSRLATKNIPADAVGKVEVLKNYNNVSQLKGLGNDEDRIAINIRLKEGKKNFWFGEITGALGQGDEDIRYQAKPKAFYYSPNVSINILTDFNNLGIQSFTFRDYIRFTGFRRGNTRASGSSIDIGAGAGGLLNLQANRAKEIESKFGAFNGAWTVNKKLSIDAFAIFSSVDTDQETIASRTFIDTGVVENTTDRSFQRNQIGLFKLGGDYKPNNDFSLEYNGQLNLSDVSQFNDFTSSRQGIVEDIDQRESQKPVTFDQSLNAYWTQSEKNIFAFEGRLIDAEEDPFYNAIRDQRNTADPEPFNGALGLTPADPYNINQQELVESFKLDAKVDYWRILNKKSNINFSLGSSFIDQDYNTGIFQILDDGSRDDLEEDQFNNDVNYRFTDLFAALHYKFITGKFTITPGVTAHRFTTRDEQLGTENKLEFEKLLPDFNLRFSLRSSENINLDYRRTVTFTDVENYALGTIFGNYNFLNSGNNQLSGSENDRVSLNYFNFNMFNYTNISAGITYTRQRDAIQSTTLIDGINQISSVINSPFANESATGFGRYSREFGKIRASVNANLSWSTFNNIINGVTQESENINHGYGISARSNYKDGVNFDLGYNIGFNNSDNGGRTNNATTQTISVDADWQINKAWFLKAEYDLNLFETNAGVDNNFDFLEAALYYQKPESSWEFKLAATNILNTEALNRNSFGQIATSTSFYTVQPRYVYLQIMYDL
ncbi:carboxypeptidase regulatory-like domain-containing protein [Nonlabens xiamenensis]|uniref:carboxypeptidase regulatory-like domain-containing protein n=1 Tax=Nonlabens xiamenensis TaxID=2341043 RepID=UPI000F605E18|nr:carboxypeptidase regulatory-like domain-containing protein [Nonlabens xiamenensis]